MNSRPDAPERPAKVMSLDGRKRPAKVETIRVDANTGEVLDPIVERHRTDVVRVINAAITKIETRTSHRPAPSGRRSPRTCLRRP